jgi:tetraacyldisaccharide 4'-kinase
VIHEKPGRLLSWLLAPPSRLFGALAHVRGLLYDSSAFEIVDTEVPIVSIGNLTAGGTGKTPITSFLTSELSSRGVQCAIVSRGYGAVEKGPAQVPNDGSPKTARRFGDEPSWLAHRHPETPVMIGAKRPESVEYLKTHTVFASAAKRLIVADDAFQHRRLRRSLDIVILDATEPEWHYQSLPLGRMRESFDALRRARFIFLSKTNLGEPAQLEWLRERIKPYRAKVVEFTSVIGGFSRLDEETVADLPVKRVVLASGIARPHTFELSVAPRAQVLKHFVFGDHHAYSAADLAEIENEASALGAEAIVVTEKDAVKLGSWQSRIPVYVSRLQAVPQSDLGEFFEAVFEILDRNAR